LQNCHRALHCAIVHFLIPLTDEQQADWAICLAHECEEAELLNDPSYAGVPAEFVAHVMRIDPIRISSGELELTYQKGRGLEVYGEEYSSPQFVAAWVQEIMRKFGHPKPLGFQISCDFVNTEEADGGGACLVTQDSIDWFWTNNWLKEQMQAIGAGLG
jgi:hypothetical protein